MTTMTVEVSNSSDVRSIVAAVRQLKGVARVKVHKESTERNVWETAIAEGAVTADDFFGEVRRQIKEHYDNHA
jgi:cell division protein FtsX